MNEKIEIELNLYSRWLIKSMGYIFEMKRLYKEKGVKEKEKLLSSVCIFHGNKLLCSNTLGMNRNRVELGSCIFH